MENTDRLHKFDMTNDTVVYWRHEESWPRPKPTIRPSESTVADGAAGRSRLRELATPGKRQDKTSTATGVLGQPDLVLKRCRSTFLIRTQVARHASQCS